MELPIAFRVEIKTEDLANASCYANMYGCPLYNAIKRSLKDFPYIGLTIGNTRASLNHNKGRVSYVWDTKLWGPHFENDINVFIRQAKEGKEFKPLILDLVQEKYAKELGLHPEFLTSETINETKTMSALKTIAVVYTATGLAADQIRKAKKYSFNTKEEVKVGDFIKSPSYTTPMLVVRVAGESFKYYNSVTGDLSNTWNSTAQEDIKELVIREESSEVVYGTII